MVASQAFPNILIPLKKTSSLSDHDEGNDNGNSDEYHHEPSTDTSSLCLSKSDLSTDDFLSDVQLPLNLRRLDLSRNRLDHLPPSLFFRLQNLIMLDVSRNHLQGLPPEIQCLKNLQELKALSNKLRLRLLALKEMASLSHLRLLDLQYNSKLKQPALDTLKKVLTQPNLEIRCTVPCPHSNSEQQQNRQEQNLHNNAKLSACDRDATQLRSQLEPLSTPQLRKRLERTFGVHLGQHGDIDSKAFDREYVMTQLLECYKQHGPRQIRLERGILVRQERLDALLHELKAIPWPLTTRERPKIRAEYYIILQKPGSGKSDSKRTLRETAKLERYSKIFDLAVETMREVDPVFCERFTALAVTKNFVGSPHIDTLNVGPFYGLALGDFEQGGGRLAVECSPLLVAELDTRGRLGKVDGRFPHWVTPYNHDRGTRYSLIYYVTSGAVEPQTTAVFPPPGGAEETSTPWSPPPVFVP